MDFKLNDKHKQFVLSYNGDSAEAMRMAGYTGTHSELERRGNELLKTAAIADAIKERSKYLAESVRMIAQTNEIQHFWSSVMRNNDPYHIPEVDKEGATIPVGNIPLATRLKSSEQLAKAQGMFIERVDIRAHVSYAELVQDAYSIPDSDLERIEMEYEARRQKKLTAKKMQKDDDIEAEYTTGDISDLF